MRLKLNMIKIVLGMALISVILVIAETRVLSWGLFNLFTGTQFNQDELDRIKAFDPDKDILYLPPIAGKNLFQSMRDLSICRRAVVRKYIYIYLTSGREYVIRAIQNSYRYHDGIDRIFKKNSDIPEELELLPLLESCYDPRAVSSSRAVGLWQFVGGTARHLGLRTNRWIDERRNVEKSTEAAIRHIRNIRGTFPDWTLTLAAYNGGAGYVKRIMDKTGIHDYWQLRHKKLMRDETNEYVPRFVALALIYNNQRLFGIADEIKKPDRVDTEYFTLRHPVDLKYVSELSGVSVGTISDLNPELNYPVIPPGAKQYRLIVPEDAGKILDEKTGELYRNRMTRVIVHRVRQGETIGEIARLYKKKQ